MVYLADPLALPGAALKTPMSFIKLVIRSRGLDKLFAYTPLTYFFSKTLCVLREYLINVCDELGHKSPATVKWTF